MKATVSKQDFSFILSEENAVIYEIEMNGIIITSVENEAEARRIAFRINKAMSA